MHLPYASGADILRQIRSNKRWAKVPIIVATADLFAAKSLQDQAEYVLVKPVGVGRLLEIASHLRDKIAENPSNDPDEKERLP
jgi:CheY-like chemotaxis protein